MKFICGDCMLVMRCVKNGQWVRDHDAEPFPATFWRADTYECSGCQVQMHAFDGPGIERPGVSEEVQDQALSFQHHTMAEAEAIQKMLLPTSRLFLKG